MRYLSCLCTALTFTAVPFLAQAETYVCALTVSANNSWIGEQLVIGHSAGEDQAIVYDPFIAHFVKEPISADVITESDKRLTVRWELRDIPAGGGITVGRFSYRATYFKDSGKVSVQAKPYSYANQFTASGTCKIDNS